MPGSIGVVSDLTAHPRKTHLSGNALPVTLRIGKLAPHHRGQCSGVYVD